MRWGKIHILTKNTPIFHFSYKNTPSFHFFHKKHPHFISCPRACSSPETTDAAVSIHSCVFVGCRRYVYLRQEVAHVLVQLCTVRELSGIQPRRRRILSTGNVSSYEFLLLCWPRVTSKITRSLTCCKPFEMRILVVVYQLAVSRIDTDNSF